MRPLLIFLCVGCGNAFRGHRTRHKCRGRGLRRQRQDLAAGVPHGAAAAGRRAAIRVAGHHLHPQGGGGDAFALVRVAGVSGHGPRSGGPGFFDRAWPGRSGGASSFAAGPGAVRVGVAQRARSDDHHVSWLVPESAGARAAHPPGTGQFDRRGGAAQERGLADLDGIAAPARKGGSGRGAGRVDAGTAAR